MERINLTNDDFAQALTLSAKAIRDGYVIAAPLEHGYVLLADAFSEFAVRAMHVIRGDELGVAAQVVIHSGEIVTGLAREISSDTRALIAEFWPGLLSLNLRPNTGLRWNLGDSGTLDRISVRVPHSEFVRALAKECGPLAIASAAPAGSAPLLNPDALALSTSEIALFCDAGVVISGPLTSVVEADSTTMTIIREGAISRQLLAAVVPALSAE